MSSKRKIGKSKTSEIDRRSFLKIGGAAAAGGALSAVLGAEILFGAPLPAKYVDKEVDSCCQFCQVRCTTRVQIKDGRVVNVYGNPDNFWTGGAMCPKGKSMVELTYSPHRLLYPLLRQGNQWKRVSYRQALDLVAERILKVKKDFPDNYAHRVAMFAPLWESWESELAARMALHLAGFPDICSPGDACIGSSSTALNLCLGSPISPTTLDEILNTEILVLFGANIAEMYPPYVRWLSLAREKGVKIIYLDPRYTPTSNFCDLQLRPRPGTDGALVLGIIRFLFDKNLINNRIARSHINGFDELNAATDSYTPAKVAEITGLSQKELISLADRLGKSERVIFWLGGAISRYTNSIQTVRAIIALQAITDNLSGSGKGIMNTQGGKPGGGENFSEIYRSPDLASRLSFRKVRYNMERGRVNVLLLNSSYRRYPDANRVREAVSKVDFVVYRGFFMDKEAELAHLIIPGTMVFESEGSQYGAQRQVVWRNKAIARPGETVEDWRFYADLGKKICDGTFPEFNAAEDIYDLFRFESPSWQGLTLERLQNSPTGVTWPFPSSSQSEVKGSLYPDNRFWTPDGKVELRIPALGPIQWTEPKGSPRSTTREVREFPLVFTQGKVVHHWQQTYTGWSSYMAQFSEGNYVQVHPDTVKGLGFKDGDEVYLETKLGQIKATLKITESILPGVVWTPSHTTPTSPFSGNAGDTINTIIPNYWDKVSAQYNGFGCRLIKA
ncbi:MAG: molybdopterin-dependent oxidoreductase [Deltaproteobacteria bacterium]|nr:molybdopterin-dependent oxidoreductase [Deltaproteobacteria bacterium]MBW2051067.1 molybdopterin-dependent oxidoreductase [Deltaproteobacteria bacterium]MBW2141006.1 molybdopterin-dependent oxidoreductase [Deltaproteobacteria bacterium]MBW2322886.1 molybdopterin-dependent oxidoreductase [Deltaproteobacteria bacterium]